MGKVRIKTIGDEELEKKQSEAARKKAEAKKAHAGLLKKKEETSKPEEEEQVVVAEETTSEEAKTEEKTLKKKEKFIKTKASTRSEGYKKVAEKVDKTKVYTLKEALEILPTLQRAKFDESVELHINTTEQGVSGTVTLPHGTGKKVRVMIADSTNDPKGLADLLQNLEASKIDFDVLVATPETMPSLAKVARVLGPRGLMPNPKNGTVSTDPKKKAAEFEAGQLSFKTEAKAPIIHLTVGKVSFGDAKLSENITTIFKKIPAEKVVSITLKSTMSPGMKIRA